MSNRDLLMKFADGTDLTVEELQTLRDSNLVAELVSGGYAMTIAGRMVLSGAWVPPNDSASCPDEDSYFPPPAKGVLDMVNHPPHYKQGDIECIDAIKAALTEEEYRGYCKGNALKYIWRERYKGGDESLAKADWYLKRVAK